MAAALLTFAAATNSAQAVTIGFEDIDSIFLTDAYGFQWTGDFSLDDIPHPDWSWVVSPASQAIFTGINAHSGSKFAWSNGGADIQIYGPEFTLNSFWARDAWDASPLVLTGYRNGLEVYSQTYSIDATYQLITVQSVLVDSVTFSTHSNLLLDDITINAVPEPETYAMLLAGLGFVGFAASRKRSAA